MKGPAHMLIDGRLICGADPEADARTPSTPKGILLRSVECEECLLELRRLAFVTDCTVEEFLGRLADEPAKETA